METSTVNAAGERVVYDYGPRYSSSDRTDRRKVTDGKRVGWQVAEMYEATHEVARRLLLGEKNVDIAKAMNITPQQVSSIRNSPVVKDKLTLMSAARDVGCIDLATEIMNLAPIALKRIQEVIETGIVLGREASANEILRESNSILDRHLGKATQTINTRNLHAHFTAEDLDRIKQKAVELAHGNGSIVIE